MCAYASFVIVTFRYCLYMRLVIVVFVCLSPSSSRIVPPRVSNRRAIVNDETPVGVQILLDNVDLEESDSQFFDSDLVTGGLGNGAQETISNVDLSSVYGNPIDVSARAAELAEFVILEMTIARDSGEEFSLFLQDAENADIEVLPSQQSAFQFAYIVSSGLVEARATGCPGKASLGVSESVDCIDEEQNLERFMLLVESCPSLWDHYTDTCEELEISATAFARKLGQVALRNHRPWILQLLGDNGRYISFCEE